MVEKKLMQRKQFNEFLRFNYEKKETEDTFKSMAFKTLLKLYAHTIITIAEMNQGQCIQN
jgi:hypothetical protein